MNVDLKELWNYGQPNQTREKFVALLEEVKDTSDLNYILELETQIARTYSLQSNFQNAHEVLDTVETRLSEETEIAQIRYTLERGRTHNSAGDKEKAKVLFKQAYVLAENASADYYAIDAIHMVAIAAANFEEKLEWTEKGIVVANQSEDPNARKWVGVFYNNAGWDLFEKARYEEALEKFIACRDFHESNANENGLSIAKWSVAKAFRFLGRCEEALVIQLQNLEDKGGEDQSGYTVEELGELYLLKGESAKAKTYFGKAYAILSTDKWLLKNESARIERLLELSK